MRASFAVVANRFIETIGLVVETAARGGFRIALIGGFALSFPGVPRATGDVDFLVDATGADTLHDALVAAGFVAKHRTENVANYTSPSARFARRSRLKVWQRSFASSRKSKSSSDRSPAASARPLGIGFCSDPRGEACRGCGRGGRVSS